jgi:hypothetical protein
MARNPELEQAWRERLARHASSGLTVRAFCEREGLATHQFAWWRRQLMIRDGQAAPVKRKRAAAKAKRSKAPRATTKPFVAVEVTPPKVPSNPIEIVLDDPPRIAVTAGFDPHVLADVLRVLENGKC